MSPRRPSAALRGSSDRLVPWPVAAAAKLLAVLSFAHFLLLTPFTNSLDDIKVVTLWAGGALCLLVWSALALREWVRMPPRIVWIPWVAYLLLLPVSGIVEAPPYALWCAWQFCATAISMTGYMLLGSAVLSTQHAVRKSLRAWTVLALVTCGFGLVHYIGVFEHLMGPLDHLYEKLNIMPGPIYNLVNTFASQREMLSTILNSQFFGNFLSMILPVCLACTVLEARHRKQDGNDPDALPRAVLWAWLAGVAALAASICTFLTFSKTAMACIAPALVGFGVLAHFRTRYRVLRVPAWPWAACFAILFLATVGFLGRADLAHRLGTFNTSAQSRRVIWDGAWQMFLDHPVLGAGPGGFRVQFPAYRSPDYHLTAVSNLTLSSHNLPLDLLCETGIVGTLFYGCFVLGVFAIGLRAFLRAPSHAMRVAILGYGLGLLLLLMGSLLTPMVRWPVGVVHLALAYGLLVGASQAGLDGDVAFDPRIVFQWTARAKLAAVSCVISAALLCVLSVWSWRFFCGSIANNEGLKSVRNSEYASQLADRTPEERDRLEEMLLASAIDSFEEAVRLNPTFVTSYYKLAHARNRIGMAAKERFYARLDDLSDQPSAIDDKRRELDELLDRSIAQQLKSIEAYDRLERYAPAYSETWMNRAIVEMTIADSLERKAAVAARFGDATGSFFEEAETHYRNAVESMKGAVSRSNKVSVVYLQGSLTEQYASILPEQSREREAQYRAAGESFRKARDLPVSVFLEEDRQLEHETEEKEKAAERAPENFERAGAWRDAAECYEWLAQHRPASTENVVLASQAWERAGEPERASAVVEKALERDPLDARVLLRRVELAIGRAEKSGDWEDAAVEAFAVDEISKELGNWLTADQRGQLQDAIRRVTAGARQPAKN